MQDQLQYDDVVEILEEKLQTNEDDAFEVSTSLWHNIITYLQKFTSAPKTIGDRIASIIATCVADIYDALRACSPHIATLIPRPEMRGAGLQALTEMGMQHHAAISPHLNCFLETKYKSLTQATLI